MDALDERLVTLLRHDARRSVSDLAVDLGVSRATVRARMERLERSGEIIGYTVVLRADAVDQRIRGIMLIEIEGHAADRVVRSSGMRTDVNRPDRSRGVSSRLSPRWPRLEWRIIGSGGGQLGSGIEEDADLQMEEVDAVEDVRAL